MHSTNAIRPVANLLPEVCAKPRLRAGPGKYRRTSTSA
jgi:hypothetical protein